MKKTTPGIALSIALFAAVACGGETRGPLDEVDAIVFIERQPRMNGLGDIFAYETYVPGARLVKLSPPTADGERTVLCCDGLAEYAEIDIIDFDVSFDAKTIVMSARLSADQRYGLFLYDVDTGSLDQLPTDPMSDYVYPTFLPGDRILFATNAVVEEGAPQFTDEYERRQTLQLGSMANDGSQQKLYSRNLSHRITSTVLSTGEVLVTQWDHLNEMNSGHLLRMNPDGTRVREAFGKEGTGGVNSYYKAVEIAPGRVIAIGSSRDRTYQSGAILDIRLGEAYEADGAIRADRNMSEANASYQNLTAQVPLGREPSSPGIGRYYSAYPLNAKEMPDLLVTWADGYVHSEVNGAAGIPPNFGVYLYDSKRGTRFPIFDREDTWEIGAMPLVPRDAPPVIAAAGKNQFSEEAVLMGAMNVYESTVLPDDADGAIYGVRVVEGFSGEEGIGADFGLSEAEGAATLGIAPIQDDGSWAALIPANVPVRQIAIDKYGIGITLEPIWISGNAGESMFCGGCHESRSGTTVVEPGITDAIAIGPVDLMSEVGRFDRLSTDFSAEPVGVPWDQALQPIFDAKCVVCHDGDASKPGNDSFTIMDEETGQTQTFVFDLSGGPVDYGLGDMMISGYSKSHLSLLGPSMMDLEDAGLVISEMMPIYIEPENARESVLIQKLNPPQLYPTVDESDRAFDGPVHPADVGRADLALTPEEYRLLIEMADNGGQFYSRENAPGRN